MSQPVHRTELGPAPSVAAGVLSYAEACDAVGPERLQALIGAAKWQRPCHDVYVDHNGPLTALQRDLVALRSCAPRSVLGGLTALAHDGMTGFTTPVPCVVSPKGARRPPYEDVRVHWSQWLDDRDVHPLRFPPRTRPSRSVLDAASWQSNERYARAIVLAAVQQRLVITRQLRETLTRRGKCRHRALIVESVLDAHGGIQSLPERDFDAIRDEIGAPVPTRQVARRRHDGKYYLDVAWLEYGTSVEIHGIPHLRVLDWESDLTRANEITIAGSALLVFSSYAIRRHRARVADQLERMLRRGGWQA